MFLNLGFPSYGPAVINAAMAHAVGLNREALGNMVLAYMIMSGLPGPLVALSVNRFGVRRTLVLGSAFTVTGSLLMGSLITTATGAMLGYGVLVGAGVATGSALASQAGLARWFVRRRSLALSILYSANAIGGFAAAPLLNAVIAANGTWRAGWWVLAGLSGIAGCVALVFVRERPEDIGQVADGLAAGAAAGTSATVLRPSFVTAREWSFAEAVRHPTYWLILASLIGCSGGYTLILAHAVVHLEDLGHATRDAAWAVGLMSVSGLIGKAILATLGDRIDPRYILAAFVAIFALGLTIIVNARTDWQMYLFAVCLGIGYGGGFVCMMSVLGNYFGIRAFASLTGFAVAVNTTLSAFAPKVAGRLFDEGLGYGFTFHVLAAWCLVSAVALCVARRPARPNGKSDTLAGAAAVVE